VLAPRAAATSGHRSRNVAGKRDQLRSRDAQAEQHVARLKAASPAAARVERRRAFALEA
jgi:hypothetical protein